MDSADMQLLAAADDLFAVVQRLPLSSRSCKHQRLNTCLCALLKLALSDCGRCNAGGCNINPLNAAKQTEEHQHFGFSRGLFLSAPGSGKLCL